MSLRGTKWNHFVITLLLFLLLDLRVVAQLQQQSNQSSTASSDRRMEQRIVGGTVAGPTLTKHMAHLIVSYRDATFTGLCTATVIAPRWLLTAAHCFAGASKAFSAVPASTYAFVGESSATLRIHNTHVEPYWVNAVYVHKLFKPKDRDHRNDIALVYLNRPIAKAKYAAVRLAPTNKDVPKAGMATTAAGYGVLNGAGATAARLMKTTLLVKPFKQCAVREHPNYRYFLSNTGQICAVSVGWPNVGRTDTCYGDSGGPLLYYSKKPAGVVQFGITSFGTSPCAERGSVSWYTRISTYHQQIQQVIRGGNRAAWKAIF